MNNESDNDIEIIGVGERKKEYDLEIIGAFFAYKKYQKVTIAQNDGVKF